jgi:hypothetical protein
MEKGGGRFFPGTVKRFMERTRCHLIAYDDGDVFKEDLMIEKWRLAGPRPIPQLTRLDPGTRLQLRWETEKGGGRFFAGTVECFNERTKCHLIAYDDGDKEEEDLMIAKWRLTGPRPATALSPIERQCAGFCQRKGCARPVLHHYYDHDLCDQNSFQIAPAALKTGEFSLFCVGCQQHWHAGCKYSSTPKMCFETFLRSGKQNDWTCSLACQAKRRAASKARKGAFAVLTVCPKKWKRVLTLCFQQFRLGGFVLSADRSEEYRQGAVGAAAADLRRQVQDNYMHGDKACYDTMNAFLENTHLPFFSNMIDTPAVPAFWKDGSIHITWILKIETFSSFLSLPSMKRCGPNCVACGGEGHGQGAVVVKSAKLIYHVNREALQIVYAHEHDNSI